MASSTRGIQAFGGNMPFLGGRRIASVYGERYTDWLTEIYGGTGDTDYVGYFFHRAAELMTPSGTMGFIATNSIAEGDNRRTVLARMVEEEQPFEIYAATTGVPWPGSAQVLVSTLHLSRALPAHSTSKKLLDGRPVARINSRLRLGKEWPEPTPLPENAGLALVGCFLRGEGFLLSPAEAHTFLTEHPEEAAVIKPFLVGDDLNNSAGQQAQRFVIDFRDWSLEEAACFPYALAILDERVRPQRERLKSTGADADHRRYWWRFANTRRELREQAERMPRFLATGRVSKHSTFAFVPSDWTPSEQVVVFPLPNATAFAVLQSRVHRIWVELQATHMGEGLRYSAGECFAPFPFPDRDPRAVIPSLVAVGEELYSARAEFMRKRGLGMTQTYNLLLDLDSDDADIEFLRRCHEDLDRVVLKAYGWSDVEVPRYEGTATAEFADTVAGQLFELNAQRASSSVQREGPGLRQTRGLKGPGTKKSAVNAVSDNKRRMAK
ncbi:MAG TPA: type IIL restriction-modification enzyme MmeI [Polyangiaceae bacterium]